MNPITSSFPTSFVRSARDDEHACFDRSIWRFYFSSQVYTNARDLARFGLLFLQDGQWQGEQLISREWIDFVRTPAPASGVRGNDYGGQWWLVPDERKNEVPSDAYSTAGNRDSTSSSSPAMTSLLFEGVSITGVRVQSMGLAERGGEGLPCGIN